MRIHAKAGRKDYTKVLVINLLLWHGSDWSLNLSVSITFVQFPLHHLPKVFSAMIKIMSWVTGSRSTVYYSVNLLTCTLCTAGVNRTGLGPKGVVVWSWVYLLGGWNRVVGETMLGSEKKSFNYYKEGTFDT